MLEQVKKLRELTEVSVMTCKKALEQAGGDIKKALLILRGQGAEIARKKAERLTGAGVVEAYVHNGQIGVLVEVRSETDFVARNEEFREFSHNIAMHIAALDPENVEKMLEQEYIKDPTMTVGDYLKQMIQKFGENIKISRFFRCSLK